MKLIHCADLHLDSRMESNLFWQQAQERNNEICETFSRMVDAAVAQGVRVVLIAGDLFDTERICAKTAAYVLDTIARASGVDFLYLKGNHDESARAFAGRRLPENLKTFGEAWTYYNYGEVCIAGIELSQDNCQTLYDTLSLSPERTNIVLLHGQVSSQPGEDLVCLPRLRHQNIRYLALGHLHSYCLEKLDEDGVYCYCGCLEGRGFDECGEKGYVQLEVENGRLSTAFHPFARRTLYDVAVDITGRETVMEISEAMQAAARDISRDSLVKFTLRGTYTPQTQKDYRFLQQKLRPLFYAVKIKDESHLEMDRASYEHDISLKGAFVRKVMASDLPQEDKEKVILAGIRALSGEEIEL